MSRDSGRVSSAETGSREPGLASRPGPAGFDPAREDAIAALWNYATDWREHPTFEGFVKRAQELGL